VLLRGTIHAHTTQDRVWLRELIPASRGAMLGERTQTSRGAGIQTLPGSDGRARATHPIRAASNPYDWCRIDSGVVEGLVVDRWSSLSMSLTESSPGPD
jgi:hypothetical protein